MLAYRDDNGTETLVARYLYDAFGNRRTDSNYCYENPNETDNHHEEHEGHEDTK